MFGCNVYITNITLNSVPTSNEFVECPLNVAKLSISHKKYEVGNERNVEHANVGSKTYGRLSKVIVWWEQRKFHLVKAVTT